MSDMETSMRGFSFMPETEIKIKEMDLQYVEDSELERAWRSSRRERIKQQEQKIWENFIHEQDIVQNVCQSDRYQFIEQLSESCLKELLRSSFENVEEQQENIEEERAEEEEHVESASTSQETPSLPDNIVMEMKDNHNVLNIFQEEKENEYLSGNEGEALNDSVGSPLCTVREKLEEQQPQPQEESSNEKEKISNKFTGSINSVIENSIYVAKVKDLRIRLNEQMLSIITSIERLNIYAVDLDELKKTLKRSSEFSSRFSRIHVYQLQRQIHDLSRTSNTHLPYGQHTQLQAYMVRVVSLHQNILQALSAFHKSFAQTLCGGDSAQLGAALAQIVRDVPAPAQPHAHVVLRDLYNDDVLVTCDKWEQTLNDHAEKIVDYIRKLEYNINKQAIKQYTSKEKQKSSPIHKTSSRADGKLSMYSLDTLRINLKTKSTTSKKNIASGTAKSICSSSKSSEKQPTKKATGKRHRSPLKQRMSRDVEVRTMVEGVAACASSHISLVPSVNISPAMPKNITHRSRVTSKESTPRSKRSEISRKSQKLKTKPNTASRGLKMECNEKVRTRDETDSEVTKSSRETNISTVTNDGFESKRSESKYKLPDSGIASADVSRLLRELCGGDGTGNKNERISGARNAQLHCVSSDSPRGSTTPQLLRILEETIQKKSPRSANVTLSMIKNTEKYRMPFNIAEKTIENLFQYRTKFVQHMLTSSMYANSAVEKPWEMVNCVSEQIIDDMLLACAKEMELQNIVQKLYESETK